MTITIAITASTIEATGIIKNAIIATAIASPTITTRITTIRTIQINTITAAIVGTPAHATPHVVRHPASLTIICATKIVIATKTTFIAATKT